MSRLAIAILFLGSLLLTPTNDGLNAASSQRTDQLLWECEGKTPEGAELLGPLMCGKYLDGILDMHAIGVAVGMPAFFCLPKTGISMDQALRIFVKWANENPAELHKTARGSVVLALRSAFPCRQ